METFETLPIPAPTAASLPAVVTIAPCRRPGSRPPRPQPRSSYVERFWLGTLGQRACGSTSSGSSCTGETIGGPETSLKAVHGAAQTPYRRRRSMMSAIACRLDAASSSALDSL